MSAQNIDFLKTDDREFGTLSQVISHIENNVHIDDIRGDLSIIGAVSDYPTKDIFLESVDSHFSIEKRNGNLFLLTAKNLHVPYYVYLNKEFPIFFTTGRKTEDLPETIDDYLWSDINIGRMWISKVEMENLKQRIVNRYPDVVIPYFTATRSQHSDIPANRRPRRKRTIQYYAKDGLETLNEMKYEYGVLPTNLKFQKANEFKFRVTTRGVFTISNGGLGEVLNVIEDSIDRLKEVKDAIDTSGYSVRSNKYKEGQNIPKSQPWAVKLQSDTIQQGIDAFKSEELSKDWEFDLAGIHHSRLEDGTGFKAELIDERSLGKVVLRSNADSIRIYPREHTGIDQSIRVFEFINDQIDPRSYAIEVA